MLITSSSHIFHIFCLDLISIVFVMISFTFFLFVFCFFKNSLSLWSLWSSAKLQTSPNICHLLVRTIFRTTTSLGICWSRTRDFVMTSTTRQIYVDPFQLLFDLTALINKNEVWYKLPSSVVISLRKKTS